MKDLVKNTDTYQLEVTSDSNSIILFGPANLSNSNTFKNIEKELDKTKNVIVNCSNLKIYDSFFVLLIFRLNEFCEANKIKLKINEMNDNLSSFYKILSPEKAAQVAKVDNESAFGKHVKYVGSVVIEMIKDSYNFISFLGELITKTLVLFIRPTQMRWKDFPGHFTKSGVNAIPITVLIMFLIGIITGYQGALQLKQFGADIYIADMIGISLTRELTPLMVAILVAGRSGSSFAAEIGTMKVSEEVDALESMGFDTTKFLVLPRVLSVTLAMPLLFVLCNVVGIAGGLIAGLATLEITITGFINQLQSTLTLYDVFSGGIKSLIFGFIIATVGCYKGLQVKGGAESVGRYTTASVVSGVFLIIFIDALFVFLFQALGI